jgi:MOSC domain-containing protein YiiM
MPREGKFAKVLEGGTVNKGDSILILDSEKQEGLN